MAGRNPEPLDEDLMLELKGLKLNLIDVLFDCVGTTKCYIPYLAVYEAELEALLGLPKETQRKGLGDIADKVIALYMKYHNGGRNSGK